MFRSRLFTATSFSAILALAVACSTTPPLPTSASSTGRASATAEGDGTLKVSTPVLIAPAPDETFESGSTVTLQFQPVSGLFISFSPAYELVIRSTTDGQTVYATTIGASASTISHTLPPVPTGAYEWQVRGAQEDGRGPWSAVRQFTMKAPARPVVVAGRRTPDPPPGSRLPAPDRFGVVAAISNQFPHFLRNSCQEHGGNWDFMDTLVDTLRLEDTRWGYAWKRGVVGDPLQDLVAYNWSDGPDEGNRNIYTIDVIGGHCGSNPVPVWNNTQPGGGPGLSAWTGRGRF